MIPAAFLAALGQIGDARFRGVLLKGLGLTIGIFVAFYAVFVWVVGWLVGDSVTLPWIGTVGWVDNVISWGAVPLMLLLSVVLMVPVASAITSFFLEDVAQAVEDKHYPGLGPAMQVPLADALRDTLSFLGVLIGANIVALVLYIFLAPFAPFIFWGLNGFLLGREYFTLAAMRRVGREGAAQLRKRHFATIWVAGVLMALPLSLPLVNLIIPILGAATFTHLFHRLQARSARA
ncbi:EI24 domain-containing protein [Salipiger sp. P9]|uniref:EI24 domain-containing protein n=1 Tax=Salipiger pentaromativorans TaxID=2943193 RepID=UPI0021585885|nr:EI24 domain-containing protein [Salipiger pentaromativorans]MCR8549001.1 EI24 domain-containing protein [Salipiger pentaromativorans]